MSEAFDWIEERIELLRQRWAEGVSTAAIGRELGVSKNAVVGKARRVGCETRPSPIRASAGSPQAQRLKRAPKVTLALKNSGPGGEACTAPAHVAPSAPAPESGQIAAVVKSVVAPGLHQCTWIDGARGSYRYCHEPAAWPKPFCVEHCKRAYAPFRARAAE